MITFMLLVWKPKLVETDLHRFPLASIYEPCSTETQYHWRGGVEGTGEREHRQSKEARE